MDSTRISQRSPTSPDGAVLVVVTGAARGASVRIPAAVGGVLRVGKGEGNDLVIPDDTVSRRHLELTRSPNGILVRDCDSTNGVRIGGALVKEALVDPGAVLHIGEIELAIRVQLAGVEIPPTETNVFGLALGQSLAMRRIFGVLLRIAPTMATVLLTGETGTGKDVLARSIHMASKRADGPFEVVDCGAIAASLIESELFGHERGAFTGAVGSHAGAFERAAGGTLFLDEIGELPIDLQPKLLRVLEAREFRRVGGSRTLTTDVRIVAATRRELVREVRNGGFREDLYFRLAVVPIEVPPLRARLEDLPMIARRLLDTTPAGTGLVLDDAALARLAAHAWPGNVRELRNVLERAAYLAAAMGETALQLGPLGATAPPEGPGAFRFDPAMSYRDTKALFERTYLAWLLARHGGNISAAAREAQMDRKHLSDLAKKHRDD